MVHLKMYMESLAKKPAWQIRRDISAKVHEKVMNEVTSEADQESILDNLAEEAM